MTDESGKKRGKVIVLHIPKFIPLPVVALCMNLLVAVLNAWRAIKRRLRP